MPDVPIERQIEAVRRFNRFYTRQIGLLEEGLLRSRFSLAEARVLYEIAHREPTTATDLCAELGLDAGYLSRILRGFQRDDLISSGRSPADGRRKLLTLTDRGRAEFARLDAGSREEVAALLGSLSTGDRAHLTSCMAGIRSVLGDAGRNDPDDAAAAYTVRGPRPGDIGWVLERNAVLYHEEYGWGWSYEALVADVLARFMRDFDPARERCWIAEREGENVGSVFVVGHPDRPGVARLRLLIVEPPARGLGIGRRLVRECTTFAREVGYHTITLWTNAVLVSARRIYEAEGYRLVHEEPHEMFGEGMIGQTWELDL
jgi:DNA-binding MarR family transcriptional regulator/GNAT superfamily N-acetyltransferase